MNKLPAWIIESRILFKRPTIAETFLSRFEGKDINVIVEEAGKEPTNPQYGYLFGVVIKELSDFTGYTPKQMLEIIKQEFHFEVIEWKGEIRKVNKSISKRKSDLPILKDIIDKTIMLAAEMGCLISEPKNNNRFWL